MKTLPARLTPALLALAFSLPVWGAEADSPEKVIVLENSSLRLELAQEPAPHIRQLVHKAGNRALVAAPARTSLFTLSGRDDSGKSFTLESSAAGESSVRVEKTGSGVNAVLHYRGFSLPGLSAEVTVACGHDQPFTLWTIRVAHEKGARLTGVRFPQLVAVPAIGESGDDFLVLPALAGTLIENPAENWTTGRVVKLGYPGQLSAQFLAYQDRSAGIYLAGRDTESRPMSLAVSKQENGFPISHEFTPTPGDGETAGGWESPYPVVLGITRGSWCDTADIYKRWAVEQKWCARTLAEREDIPAWWKKGPAVHVCAVRTFDDQRICTGSYYPKLHDHLRTFREKIDGPVVAMLASWENHRRWTGGDYFPVFDQATAAKVIPQLSQDGIRPFFFLSGLFYTYWNEGRDGGRIPSAQDYLSSYVVEENTGKPKEYLLNESNPSGDWKRHSYEFCVAAPETRKFFLDVVDRAHALGVDVLQMDQTTSGAGDACHSADHGHAPGAGLYQSRAFHELLDAMREHGKRLSPDFVLFHEEPHEQLIPHLDGFHVREYYEKRWYRGYPGSVGIPLFCYLYHEYASGYGGDSAGLSRENSRWNVRCHARNLVCGRTPGASIWSSHQSLFDAHPDQIAVIRNHSRLLKTSAGEFLMLGKMLHPFELPGPKLVITVPAQREGKWVREDLSTDAVLTSSWQLPGGRVGHLFVNIAETAQPLAVAIDARNAPAPEPFTVRIYRSTAGESFQPLWTGARLPKEFSTELRPLEVVFLDLTPAAES